MLLFIAAERNQAAILACRAFAISAEQENGARRGLVISIYIAVFIMFFVLCF